MKKTAFIWRESVYKNHFKCNLCGTPVADEDGTVLDRTLYHRLEEILLCPKCHNVVCKIKEIDVPENMKGLQGNYSDYIGGGKND